ncbi:MAG: helix-turn-helix transcriptional regulator, partial [Spirochaetota bacterium]
MSVENRIRILREHKRLIQKDFGDILGLTLSNVSQIERGKAKASVDLIGKIIESFNVSSNWLLTGEGEMFLPTEEEKKAATRPSLDALVATKDDLEETKGELEELRK